MSRCGCVRACSSWWIVLPVTADVNAIEEKVLLQCFFVARSPMEPHKGETFAGDSDAREIIANWLFNADPKDKRLFLNYLRSAMKSGLQQDMSEAVLAQADLIPMPMTQRQSSNKVLPLPQVEGEATHNTAGQHDTVMVVESLDHEGDGPQM
eukprot:GFYU01026627.1.p1 GENE.GFYU01026627.1~~GFYU01026627.1.p1  ORF type:complete len:152 (-),score=10.13 GFYU01026627.1:345-800(-)